MPKRKGAIIPDPIDTPGTRKVVVCIPDTVEWLSLFTGLVSQLRYGWYWDRSTGDLDAIRERAKRVYFEMQEQDGDCMDLDCDQVAECIENSEAVQKAIQRLMFGGTAPGDKMSATKRNADMGPGYNPTCSRDILWAQCLAIVTRMNDFLTSFCTAVETQTNSVEIGTFIASLPGVENLGVSSLTGLADTLFAALPENYATDYGAADPETGIFWYEIFACDIMCACEEDCEITIERIWQVLQDRLEAQIAGLADDWTDLLAWILDFANLDITIVNMADFFYYLAFSGLRLGGTLLVTPATGDKVLQVAVALAADEPSNDWMSLCDCPDEYCHAFDFEEEEDRGWSPYDVGGLGFGADLTISGWEDIDNTSTGGNNRAVSIKLPMPGTVHVTRIAFKASMEMGIYSVPSEGAISIDTYVIATGVRTNHLFIAASDVISGADQTFYVDVDLNLTAADGIGLFARCSRRFGAAPTGNVILTEATICGTGEDPFA